MPRRLILVPTEMERRLLAPILDPSMPQDCRLALCGFGPVAAAARTAQLLAEQAPERVLLVGIAGSLDDRLTVGAAYHFDRVACYGIGAGNGGEFVPAETLGWHQWPGDTVGTSPPREGQRGDLSNDPIGDLIACPPGVGNRGGRADLLLTVCAAAANSEDVRLRKQTFPAAMAEDMEAFAVAFACRLRGVPVDLVRGISNVAGERDKSRWQVAAAVESVGRLALQIMAEAP